MADEKKPGAGAVFLSKHGEKLALGLAGAALLGYLLFGVVLAGKDKGADELAAQIARINTETGAEHAPMKAPAAKDHVTPVRNTWNAVTKAQSAGNWSAGVPTKFIGEPIKGIVETPRLVKTPTIAWGNAEVTLEGVNLTWTVVDFTKAELAAGAKTTDFLKLTGLTLERRTNDSDKWEVLADALPPATTSYKDSKIDPKTRYSYRLTSHLEKNAKHPDVKGMTVGTAAPVATQSIWKLNFSQAMKGQVYVEIEKFDKNVGNKVGIKHMQHVGDKIGWWVDRSPEPVSKHFVPLKGGKTVEVDFNTGMELKSVEPVSLTLELKKCKPKFTPDGKKLGCDTLVEKRSFSTTEIVYTDDEGEKKAYVPHPQVSDQMCDEHSGKKLEVKLPGTGPEKTPEQVKEEAAETVKAKKEKEAEALFKQAEKDEVSNKAQARKNYDRLLKEYLTTDFVSKQKKAIIEDRLGRLSQ